MRSAPPPHAAQAETLAKSLPANGGGHVVVKADLYDRKQIAKAAEEVVKGLGGLDIFVHSAGIDVTQTAVTHETLEETWDKMMNLHLNAAFFLSKGADPDHAEGQQALHGCSSARSAGWWPGKAMSPTTWPRPGCSIWRAASLRIMQSRACAPM